MVERGIPHELLTVQEYLEMEEIASVRHEYVGGMVYATVGATKGGTTGSPATSMPAFWRLPEGVPAACTWRPSSYGWRT
jgi:hypothetical protein